MRNKHSTKKGPGRKHYEPSDEAARPDKIEAVKELASARCVSGAKRIRRAMQGELTRR